MSMRHWIESSLAGAGIGAVLMYLFDPELGEKRRETARQTASEGFSSAGERIGGGWQALADKAQDVAHEVASKAGRWTSKAGSAFSDVGSSAGDYAEQAASRAKSYGSALSKSARGWMSHETEGSHISATEAAIGTVGALALGAGLMYLMDPAQGHRRRAYLRDKANRAMNQSSRYVERKGRHLGNKAQGWAAEASHMAGEAKEKIMGEATPGAEATKI